MVPNKICEISNTWTIQAKGFSYLTLVLFVVADLELNRFGYKFSDRLTNRIFPYKLNFDTRAWG